MNDAVNVLKEYGWSDPKATHAHSYVLPAVEKAINDAVRMHNLSHEKLKIFDAGCGNGFTAGYLLSKGHAVTGCDVSSDGVEIARNKYPAGRFEVASVYEDLGGMFGDQWDLVVSTEVVEHLYDPRKYVQNLYAMLKPGGCLIITTPYHGYIKNLLLATTGKLDNHFTALWDGGHIKFWSRDTLGELLREAGFRLSGFYGAGRLPYLWKSMVLLARKEHSV